MNDRMLDGDRVLWSIGGSSEHAQETLAAGHAWTSKQRARSGQIAISAGYPPWQPAGYPPTQQQVLVREPAPVYEAPVQPAAFDGVLGGDGARGDTVNYGAAQPTQPAQQPAAIVLPQPQIATPAQPQLQGYRPQPLPTVTEVEAPQSDVSQYPDNTPHCGWVLPVVTVSIPVLGLVGGALGGHWLQPGKSAAAPSFSTAAAPTTNKSITLHAGSGSFVCSSGGTGVFCWGTDVQANTQGARVSPTAVPGLKKVKVSVLSVGKSFAVVVDDSGKAHVWGTSEVGQLGKKADEALVNQAVRVGELPTAFTVPVSGYEYTCVLAKGTVWYSGSSRYGQVSGTVPSTSLGLVGVDETDGATQAGTSGYDTQATADEGTWAWGNNPWGQVDPSQGVVSATSTLIPADS